MNTPFREQEMLRKIRFSLLFVIISVMALVLFESNYNVSNAAAVVYLKPEREIIVRNNEVRMSDLFFNVSPNDDRIVAAAPRVGAKLMFRFRDLETFIRKSNLSWQPRSNRGSRIITRASRQLHPDIIHDLLEKELSSRIFNYEVEVELFNRKKRILVPDEEPIQPTITELHYDDRSRLFKASLLILSNNTEQTKIGITGRAHPLIAMPVLNTHLSPGDIIKPPHITWKNIRVKRTNYNTISSAKELVDKVARRPLIAGRIIRLSDVESLKLVNKGDFVTVQLRNATMSLSTRGISTESGSKNDIIRIKNPRSNKIIEAKVIAPNLTIIQMPQNIVPN
tara:strand:+ start:1114 stop:2127 length:1014 start_codon:yes stop_codon:yes gene_type:complete